MQIGPFVVTLKKSAQNLITQWTPPSTMGWWPWIRESFAGAWQRGIVTPVEDALTHPTFWACVTLIAGDIAKMRVKLMEEDDVTGIATEVTRSAYSPVLRKPNHYQNRIQFYTYWILSKLTRGNAYALKARDNRGVVTALYLLDPTRCRPMVSPNGEVFYALTQDLLSGISEASVVVPAREVIHDTMFALYHPLVGLSPVYACGHAAMQGLQIVNNTTRLFQNGSQVGGLLVAPGTISNETAARLQKYWEENYAGPQNAGRVAVLGDGLTFQKPPVMSAVDAQLIDQLKWGDEKICSVFHVPPYMVGVGGMPQYNNVEALNQQYYSQCLQILIESLELSLDEGLEFDPNGSLGVEMDIDALLRMDSATKMKSATEGVLGGVYSPNEARTRFNLPPVAGGESPYLQQQNYSLAALAKRDASADPFENVRQTFTGPAPALPPASAGETTTGEVPAMPPTKDLDEADLLRIELALTKKGLEWERAA